MSTPSPTEDKIRQQLADNPIILYMKGVPEAPECGFSAKAVAALQGTGIPFSYVNVLAAPFIREKLPKISHWPTFPQLFVAGELVGGSDIVEDMALKGTLKPLLENAAGKSTEARSMEISEIRGLIEAALPNCRLAVEGEGCNFSVVVVSQEFEGVSPVRRQQKVLAAVKEPLSTGALHAMSMKVYTPAEWEAEKPADSDLVQIG